MKFALGAVGTRGDVQPMIGLAQALRASGHEAVICAPSYFEPLVSRHGIPFRSIGHLKPEGGPTEFRKLIEEQHAELLPAVQGCDYVLATGVLLAGATAAEALGIPYRYVVLCSRVQRSQYHPPVGVPWSSCPRWLNRVLWWPVTRGGGSVDRVVHTYRQKLGLPPVSSVYQHFMGSRPLVATDPTLAPLPPDHIGESVQTGAWFVTEQEPLPEDLEAFLAEGEPPVYVGFGSMPDEDARATTRLLLEVASAANLRMLIHGGRAELGLGEHLPASLKVIGSVPHAKLLPRVAAVVHHGGAGTTHAAAAAGVPQVIVPHVTDQFYWAQRVHALELGPKPISRRQLSAERLTAALRSCQRSGFGQRARDIARQMVADGPNRAVAALLSATGGSSTPTP